MSPQLYFALFVCVNLIFITQVDGRVIFKNKDILVGGHLIKLVNNMDVDINQGNIITAPMKACPSNQKLDNRNRCRKVH